MSVHVDEARRDDQPAGVDHLRGLGARHAADGDDAAVLDGDVGGAAGRPVPSITVPPAMSRS